MDSHAFEGALIMGGAILLLVLLQLLSRPAPDVPQDQDEPQVWEVLEEARRITQQAAE